MTPHPNRGRTYWILHPRNRGRTYWLRHKLNEYTIGVASTHADAQLYNAKDFERIPRVNALVLMSRQPDNEEQLCVLLDGEVVNDRLEFARSLRAGSGRDLR